MARRVHTPRRVFRSVAELARHLGTCDEVLHNGPYLELRADDAYDLRPIDEARYARWHRTVWARAQRHKEAA